MGHRPGSFSAEQLLDSLGALAPARAYYVGFSGGADSTALLQALHELGLGITAPFKAVHVNHGLHADADRWQQHCKVYCQQRGIKLICIRIDLPDRTVQGIEAEARHLRYQAMAALLGPGENLLTAHHADDQTETILLNLLRGSGVDGLAAMPAERPLGAGMLQRPLLEFDNHALRDYLRARDTTWLEDPSNQLLAHDRNFIRHEIIPVMERRWPGVNQRLSLTRRIMAETRPLLETMADDVLQRCLAHPLVLRLAALPNAEPGLFKLVVRRWIRQTGAPPIPVHRLESLAQQIATADSDNRIRIAWKSCTVYVFKGCLWLQTKHKIKPCSEVSWPPYSPTAELGVDIGRLEFIGGLPPPPGPQYVTRGRHCDPGNSILRNGHHLHLKNIFQAAAIPTWLRNTIPLTSMDGELAAVGDWCISDRFKTWLGKNQLKWVWQPHHPLLQYVHDQQHIQQAVSTHDDGLK